MIACATECDRRIATACPFPSEAEARRCCVRFRLLVVTTVVRGQGSGVRVSTKRQRPADGGIVWHPEMHAFECLGGCDDWFEVHKAADRTPEPLAELKEMLIADHVECWEFDDPEMVRQARKYRKKKKLRENVAGVRVQGSGVSQNGVLDCSRYLRGR